jgi:hypothetical protein
MKAIEYFKKYKEKLKEPNDIGSEQDYKYYCVVSTLMDFFNEVKTIQLARKAKSNSAMIAIMNEQNLKANSFIKMINLDYNLGINRDEFKDFIKDQMPDLAKMIAWN